MADLPPSEQYERDARIVSQHLLDGHTAGPEAMVDDDEASDSDAASIPQSSLTLQGGDVHRDLYKIRAKAMLHKRAHTFGAPAVEHPEDFPVPENSISASDQLAPNGFRRQYLLQRSPSFIRQDELPVPRSFINFLDLYGGFAGEDFDESGDEDADTISSQQPEARPLLPRRRSSRQTRHGDASSTRSLFTLFKAFIGTGILFLPKAFRNGGILFSSLTLVTVAIISYTCFTLLLACREKYQIGYGEMGELVAGKWLRRLILTSIFVSQMGFVCACLIFTAENLAAFLEAVPISARTPSVNELVVLQLLVLIPLAWIRNVSKLGPLALAADIFILFGLGYIWWYTTSVLVTRGMDPTVKLFNPNDFALTIGSSIFTFEGIGLVLPIQASMARPERFPTVLLAVMLTITVIFTSIGAMCYATFGVRTRVEIISNFPADSKLVNAVQFLYAIAILGSTPVQLFPAVRIVETSWFGNKSGGGSLSVKWKKNFLRAGLACTCAVVSMFGASDLDKFVALSGSFACVPLVYIYPPLLHLRSVATSRWAKALDISIISVGVVAMGFSTFVTLLKWSQ